MRKLNKAQRTLISKSSMITPKVISQLEKMNDYETLISDAHRLHNDLEIQRMHHTVQSFMFPTKKETFNEEKFLKDWN